ncbi:MAG TPA: transporter substrate-binding domain-containing protein [Burkholderiaceae bacterium]|jgi:polar amino acid transport system substrate-binding protein|nr:transporter substrate-binding domain-containing protein [Burkholderiaceae bacterium]
MSLRIPASMLLAAMLAGVGASASDLPDRVQRRGTLTAGISHVAPAYVAGAKFRTPEAIEAALAENLAQRLSAKPAVVPAAPAQRLQLLGAGQADLLLTTVAESDALRRAATVVPTGYTVGPMAILRSDTTIKRWEQLKGRTVCVAGDGRYAGTIAAQYGAIEKVFKAPADSLLALRIGQCDAAVHDSALLEDLIKLPEWKKFSATLPTGPRIPLVFAAPAGDARARAFLQQVAADWRSSGYLAQLNRQRARNIAFEVYLDQDVPDCH